MNEAIDHLQEAAGIADQLYAEGALNQWGGRDGYGESEITSPELSHILGMANFHALVGVGQQLRRIADHLEGKQPAELADPHDVPTRLDKLCDEMMAAAKELANTN